MRMVNRDLMAYGKASGAFEYAAKRYMEDNLNQRLKQEVTAAFNYLEREAYPPIEAAYNNAPESKETASAYEIATRDLMEMRNKWQSLP